MTGCCPQTRVNERKKIEIPDEILKPTKNHFYYINTLVENIVDRYNQTLKYIKQQKGTSVQCIHLKLY